MRQFYTSLRNVCPATNLGSHVQNKQHGILTYSLFVLVLKLICQYRPATCEISGCCHGAVEWRPRPLSFIWNHNSVNWRNIQLMMWRWVWLWTQRNSRSPRMVCSCLSCRKGSSLLLNVKLLSPFLYYPYLPPLPPIQIIQSYSSVSYNKQLTWATTESCCWRLVNMLDSFLWRGDTLDSILNFVLTTFFSLSDKCLFSVTSSFRSLRSDACSAWRYWNTWETHLIQLSHESI